MIVDKKLLSIAFPRRVKEEKYMRTDRGTGGRVREQGVRDQQRLGMSQGTMIREPKYGGGAHPKYGSCRGLVSPIPRAGM